ncbi:conserved Plasmodium protein, unknown function [Plasmodium gallinaceum]|uniref:Radial spoke head protein 9 homolog n=1 Tax=Plasmodium gallinaceum TaxID=5849 RepID=A0A1J1GZK7_PLAGA|nr:conserved Plasmodium protein, unknown function [Plasmodium gallinaceum]CRG97727.1 conserved Plasmodium protein, unknown function [Plasmodium gallinaceum]
MINLKNLDFHLENLCESNRCFNDEEKLGLLYGMINLEDKIKKEIYLWGKIEGVQNDYYITYYFNYDDFFPNKKFFYCNNDYEFHEIKKGNDTLIKNIEKKTPFTLFNGTPNSFYWRNDKKKMRKEKNNEDSENEESANEDSENESNESNDNENDDNENNDSENNDNENDDNENDDNENEGSENDNNKNEKNIKDKNEMVEKNENNKKDDNQNVIELERLSYIVRKIDEEAFIIPYNSVKITNNLEVKFSNFSGLNILDALKLTSWVHFRYPKNLTYDKIKNYDTFFLNNFLDSIESDNPTNMWNIKINEELSKISIINHLYPGYIFYHILNTPFYASLYIGNGISNYDLPFLLP